MKGCRVCKSEKALSILNLGKLPLANGLVRKESLHDHPTFIYPLELVQCQDCQLVQLGEVVNSELMFDGYPYMTSSSQTMINHFDNYADAVTDEYHLSSEDLVVDIGSNDGILLEAFKKRGVRVLGVEPARNLAAYANAMGIDTLPEYFTLETARKIKMLSGDVRVVTANNILSHVDDLAGFLALVKWLIGNKGVLVFEMPWIVDIVKHGTFDLIYHEHLSYFGFKPLKQLLMSLGINLLSLEHFRSIHGGSYRGFAAVGSKREQNGSLEAIFEEEAKYAGLIALCDFASKAQATGKDLSRMVKELKGSGKTIAGYGAPAKATILLNYCGLDNSLISFVSDTTRFKQGKYIPGVKIPIVTPEDFRRRQPEYALMLAWNYEREILAKEKDYLQNGGKFIIPFPEPHVVP